MYEADTCTVGGAISGYFSIARPFKAKMPRKTIATEMQIARTGRLMNIFLLIIILQS